MPKAVDLKGQRFGALTVIERMKDEHGRPTWLCECDCGQRCSVATGVLRSGHKTSCGCGAHRIKRASETKRTDEFMEKQLQKVRSDNQSGVTGVSFDQASGKWDARISIDGKRVFLGRFTDLDEAKEARRRAEQELLDQAAKKG